ncbi:MAG: thioredoxin fold domain-containing protein [Gammaproteobacteria bacterium]|nr:thioredoxin fold domain-containing protein [Gammaproteobacteria bacterium]
MSKLLSSYRQHLLSLLCLLFFPVFSVVAAPPETYKFLSLTEAMQQASAQNKPMFLYFGRYGCSTCRKMHKEVFTNDEMQEKYNRDFVLAYVDTESGKRIKLPSGERMTEMQFASRNRILGTPTFIYFSKEQKPLFKKAGFQSIEQMNAYGDFIRGGHYQTKTLKQYLAAK